MNTWIVLIALAGIGCALALTYLCLFRNAPLRDDMAEADDHPHPVPQQRESVDPTTLAVVWDERVDGEMPTKLSRMSA